MNAKKVAKSECAEFVAAYQEALKTPPPASGTPAPSTPTTPPPRRPPAPTS